MFDETPLKSKQEVEGEIAEKKESRRLKFSFVELLIKFKYFGTLDEKILKFISMLAINESISIADCMKLPEKKDPLINALIKFVSIKIPCVALFDVISLLQT
jgi:hypothetical protein